MHGQLLIPSMPIHVAYRSGHFAPSVCYGRQISARGCCEKVGTCDRPPAEFSICASSAVRSGAARPSCRNLQLQPRVAAWKCPANVPLFRNAPASGCRVSVELRQAKGGAGSDRVAAGVGLLCIWHCDARAKVPKRQGRAVEGARWISSCLNANGCY